MGVELVLVPAPMWGVWGGRTCVFIVAKIELPFLGSELRQHV